MTEADLDQVLAIEVQAFPSPWTRRNFLAELRENPHALNRVVRTEDRRVVAYASAWKIAGEVKLNNIAVHPAWLRQGLAVRLLRALIADARRGRCSVLTLEVRVSNTAARSLYRKLGFYEDGVREKYYPTENEDAILMSLALKSD